MTAALKDMSAAAIRERLAEVGRLEAVHKARDLDVEIHAVMRAGGDVDAMEEKQLDAERAARRLRVERSALEAELPATVKREAELSMKTFVERHDALAIEAGRIVDDAHAAWNTLHRSVKAWEEAQGRAISITEQAYSLCQKAGATMPSLGNLQSSKLCEVAREAQYVSNRLASAEHQMQVGFSVQGRRLD